MSHAQSLDSQPIRSQLLDDDPDMRDIVQEFVDGLPGRIDEFKNAIQQVDWERLATLSHRLKGAGGSHGYPDLSRAAALLEESICHRSVDQLAARIGELEGLAAAVRAGLS